MIRRAKRTARSTTDMSSDRLAACLTMEAAYLEDNNKKRRVATSVTERSVGILQV